MLSLMTHLLTLTVELPYEQTAPLFDVQPLTIQAFSVFWLVLYE